MNISECYTALNVSPETQWAEVKRSYHFLAKKYHPDVHPNKPGMTSRFRNISEAFKILEVRHKSGPKKRAQWQEIKKQRIRFAQKQNEVEPGKPQMATPLGGKSPTQLNFGRKNNPQTIDNAERGINRLGAVIFEMEKKVFLLDIRKNIFLKKHLPSHANIVRIKKGDESFQVRIPPGPWTRMFIRVPQKGNRSMFSNKRGDLLLNINVPNRMSLDPAPAVYYYKVRIPETAIGTDKVWTLKSATGPIKFTLPKTAQQGDKFTLKSKQDSTVVASVSHVITLSLI